MPSPSSASRCGEPTVSTQITSVRSRGRSAKWRRANACIPSMNDSSEPVESRITRTPGTGSSRGAAESRTATPVRLSLAPGTTGAARCPPSRRRSPRTGTCRGARRPEGHEQRAGHRAPHRPGRGLGVLGQLREPAQDRPRQLGMEHQARVGGVVVGDHDHRVRPLAELRHHVGGLPAGEEPPPEPLLAAGDVVDHRRGREQADDQARKTPAQRAREPGERREDARPATSSRRGPAPPRARRPELLGDQLGRAALPVGGRPTLDRGQALDPLAQLVFGQEAHRRAR